MSANPYIDPTDFRALVEQLADPVRAKQAYRHLVRGGAAALCAVRDGLADARGDVRMYCVRALDQLVDEEAWPEVIAMLDDPDPRVRVHALHAIACDRCKEDTCRPDKADVLPRAIRLLGEDPSYHVRAMAIEVVGAWVYDDHDALAALEFAHAGDPAPVVRKKAGWHVPGGVLYRKNGPEKKRAEKNRRSARRGGRRP